MRSPMHWSIDFVKFDRPVIDHQHWLKVWPNLCQAEPIEGDQVK